MLFFHVFVHEKLIQFHVSINHGPRLLLVEICNIFFTYNYYPYEQHGRNQDLIVIGA